MTTESAPTDKEQFLFIDGLEATENISIRYSEDKWIVKISVHTLPDIKLISASRRAKFS